IRAGVLGDNKVIGVLTQLFAKLLGSNNNLRTDSEVHFIELLQAAFYFRCVTMDKEDVQRRMSAFRSAEGVSLETSLWGRSHWNLSSIPGSQSFPLPCWLPRMGSKHLKARTGG